MYDGAMNIQIIGTKKCKDTQKAERFFKDRNINYHFADLKERGLSKGELNNIAAGRDLEDLIDVNSKEYKKKNLQFMDFDPAEELLEHPELLVTPVIRIDKKVYVGFDAKALKKALESA